MCMPRGLKVPIFIGATNQQLNDRGRIRKRGIPHTHTLKASRRLRRIQFLEWKRFFVSVLLGLDTPHAHEGFVGRTRDQEHYWS